MSAREENEMERPFFTMKEAAAYACCSVRTLERRIKEGAIRCFRNGCKRLIRKAELEAYLTPPSVGDE